MHFSMFRPKRILVAGTGRIARRICKELVASGRPLDRADDLDRATARLHTAKTLIVVDAAADTSALRRIAGLCRRRPARHRPLRLILVRTENGSTDPPTVPDGANLSFEIFDPQAQAARSLLARWPLHAGMDPPYGQTPHILFAGFATPAPELLVQTLRLVHYGDQTPIVTLADEDPEARRDRVVDAFPQASRFCRLRFTSIEDIDLTRTPPVTGAYVCMKSPEQGLAIARRVAARIAGEQRASPLIHLDIGDIDPAGKPEDWDGQLVPFSWLHEACRPEVLLDGREDELARVIHEHYRDSIAAQGRDPDSEPAGRPWGSLDTSYRDASRHQADHLNAKLAMLDCRAVREELVESFTFAPLEAERLAIVEHKRWAADRYLDGWTYAPERDNARKHHPQLIPYEELSEPMKDLDRFAVRLAPTLLARSGRGLVHLLLVTLVEPKEKDCRADQDLQRLAGKALQRLTQRYPDRSLVLASTLESEASRLVARLALDERETDLFLLCPRPLHETLAAQTTEQQRRDLLEIAARAERRISLPGIGALEAWLAQRAEIELLLGMETNANTAVKQVVLNPRTGQATWNFEY